MKPSKRALLTTTVLLAVSTTTALAAEVQARLDWARRVALGVPVSGVITEVSVRPGEVVQQGQMLLKLDQRGFAARLAAAKAKVDGMTHAHGEAQRELERAEELYERMLLSDHELVEARVAFGNADAAFRSAQAELAEAQMDLEYSEIRAPYTGVVIARRAEAGQTVAAELQSVALIDLAESGRMVAEARVGLGQVEKVQLGDKVAVKVGAKRYEGTIAGVGAEPVAEGKEGALYSVRVAFDTGGQLFRPGQAARITLP